MAAIFCNEVAQGFCPLKTPPFGYNRLVLKKSSVVDDDVKDTFVQEVEMEVDDWIKANVDEFASLHGEVGKVRQPNEWFTQAITDELFVPPRPISSTSPFVKGTSSSTEWFMQAIMEGKDILMAKPVEVSNDIVGPVSWFTEAMQSAKPKVIPAMKVDDDVDSNTNDWFSYAIMKQEPPTLPTTTTAPTKPTKSKKHNEWFSEAIL